jgi:hypothetical protein
VDLTRYANDLDIHVVAGVLKQWLRELQEPLLTLELYEGFIAAEGIADVETRKQCIQNLVESLPQCNYSVLELIARVLHKVTSITS